MRRKLLAGVCVVMFGISGMAYSDDTTVTLDGNTSGSGFSIKDSSGTSIARFQGDGKVGIGTTAPSHKLDVGGEGNAGAYSRLGGMSILTADTGYEWWTGSYTVAGLWQLTRRKISDGTWENAITVNTSGNVGIGTTAPECKLEVIGSSKISGNLGTNGYNPDTGYPSGWGGGIHTWDVYAEGSVGVGIGGSLNAYITRDGTAYCLSGMWSGSDERWKKDVHPLENSLSNVLKLRGVNYFWKTEEYPNKGFSEDRQIGLIAQEVEKVFQELVHTDNEGYKSVSYEKLIAVLIEAVKEQQKLIVQQQKENEMQQKQIEELKEMMNKAIQLASVK